MFIVTPYISSNKALFGIYSVIIATSIFFAYSDLGFLSAGLKYACEYYARNDRANEIKVIGFAGFILLIFILIYSIALLCISFFPQILVKSLLSAKDFHIAKHLLLILAFYSPFVALQRITQIIFSVRMEDYKYQRVAIFFSFLKILSAFYFFGRGNYQIINYFLFSQVCNVLTVFVGLYLVKISYQYDLKLLFSSFVFSKDIFDKTKKLAFTSLFITLCWIVFYEIDLLVIGGLLGPTFAATFAVGLTILSYFRTLFGIFYSPFIAKFNYYIGLNNDQGLKEYFSKVVKIGVAFTIFPVLIVALTVNNFIINWVGSDYISSIPIAKVLILSYLFTFISQPAGIVITAYERLKMLNFTSILQPFLYWIGIGLTYKYLELNSFAYFKFIAFAVAAIAYFIIIAKLFNFNILPFISETILPALPSVISILITSYLIVNYSEAEKSKIHLLIYCVYCGISLALSIVIYYFCSTIFREFTNSIMVKYKFLITNS